MACLWAFVFGDLPALLFVAYVPSLNGVFLVWMYTYAAFGVILYRILDMLTGNQSKRLKAFSPCGRIFDYGSDSLTLGSSVILWLVGMKIPYTELSMFVYLVYMVAVYSINLSEKFNPSKTLIIGKISLACVVILKSCLLVGAAFGWSDFLYKRELGYSSINCIIAIITIFVLSCIAFLGIFNAFTGTGSFREVARSFSMLIYLVLVGSLLSCSVHIHV